MLSPFRRRDACQRWGESGAAGPFSWLPRLYWTTAFPALAQTLLHIPLFNLTANTAGESAANNGNAKFLLALLVLAFLFTLLASLIGRRVLQKRPAVGQMRLLYGTVLIFTVLFGVTYLYAPPVLAQNVFLYGFFGRIVAVYHLNPYLIMPSSFPRDLLYPLLASSAHGVTALSGPVWIDMSIPIALLAHASVANVLLAFRVLGLGVHLLNTILVWAILAKLKPETRLSATLLYGWNPLVLLFSIGAMQQEVVIVFFLLLAVLFFQRNSFLLGWVFLLLAALVSVLCLLLLPLFFRLLQREMRSLSLGRRLLWWLGCLALSSLVVVLAFAPYWSGWGLSGLDAWLALAFWPGNAINSLDAALINLPVQLLPAFSWLVAPQHWLLLAAITVALFLLLGIWLIDTLEMALLFGSWIFLALFILFPTSWPWFLLVPLALTLCAANGRTLLLIVFLSLGALVSYYCWLLHPVWQGQALITIGLPLLLWGWLLFFTSTWQMTRAGNGQEMPEADQTARAANAAQTRQRGRGFSRPSWSGRRRVP